MKQSLAGWAGSSTPSFQLTSQRLFVGAGLDRVRNVNRLDIFRRLAVSTPRPQKQERGSGLYWLLDHLYEPNRFFIRRSKLTLRPIWGGFLNRNLAADFVDGGWADAFNVIEIVHPGEWAVLVAVVDDGLGFARPDAVQGFQGR